MTLARNGGGGQSDALALLAVELGKLRERVEQVAGKVDAAAPVLSAAADLGEQVAALTETVAQLTEDEESGIGPVRTWSWVRMTEDERAQRLGELESWVYEVLYPTYGDYLRDERIASCWKQHETAIMELAWLYHLWYNAYLPDKRTPRDAGDWHDRWLPSVLGRLDGVFKTCGHRAREATAPTNTQVIRRTPR
ncbi:hypothetical protein Pth03_78060 [Planotetraspora thailandica]|uniref:DUF4913 domain-containing protein n=1 Tax=Planotetraspora thailandica TaxID=487172 RepID=A0A8J4DG66_9ACTN|nr:hypothetical protein [Planotetraspora thailandica]GII59417.1 hypothetical protein Pth03_78060 [Planotetraspora thailandica]